MVPALIGVVDIPWSRAIGKSEMFPARPAVSKGGQADDWLTRFANNKRGKL